jgi:hypothetical protein
MYGCQQHESTATLVLGSSSATKQGWIEDDLPELLKRGGKGVAEFLFF